MKLIMRKLNHKGSALVFVLIILFILSILGFGIISGTMNNMKTTETLSEYEKAFYCAQTAVNNAIAAVKDQASRQYMAMFNASASDYYSYYNNFFMNLERYVATSSADCVFQEPDFKEFTDSTSTEISMDPAPSDWPAGYAPEMVTIRIVSTGTVGGSSRTLHADLEVKNLGIDFKKTSSPPISGYTVMTGGDIDPGPKNNSNITVTGNTIVWGNFPSTKFNCTGELLDPKTDGDPTNDNPDDYIDWHLDYSAFLSKLPNTQAALLDPVLPGPGYPVTSTAAVWSNTTISNQVIDVVGDLNITDCELVDSIIRATGAITITGNNTITESITGCQISAGGKITVKARNMMNTCIRSDYSGPGEAVYISLGSSSYKGNLSTCHINAAHGNIVIQSNSSAASLQNVQNSNIYAAGSLRIGDDVGKAKDIDVGNIRDCYIVAEGDVTLATIVMNASSYGKCLARSKQGAVLLNNLETDNCLVYAYDSLTLHSLGFDKVEVGPSEGNVFVARQRLIIRDAKIVGSYFFSGDYMEIELNGNPNNQSGSRDGYTSYIDDSLMYAENMVYYLSGFSARRDAIHGTLIYTNGDFVFHGKGTDLAAQQGDAHFIAQLIAKGKLSYDWDLNYPDRLFVGALNSADNQALLFDKILAIFGDGGIASDGMEVSSLNLYNIGFEQLLPPELWKKYLPSYSEVFTSEKIYE